ncbi:MAG: hypothetical protein ABWX90_00900 [Candidatus Saccharimonadales bacterium]
MNVAVLNGRPVMVGTKLKYKEECGDMCNDSHVVVTNLTENGFVSYNYGGEIDGQVRENELANTFEHLEEVNLNQNEYQLSSITDLLMIPDDRLEICLHELLLAVRTNRTVMAATIAEYEQFGSMKFTPQDVRVLWNLQMPSIRWQDNGENKSEVNMNGTSILSVKIVTPEVDPMDVNIGDHEYYVLNLEGQVVANINAFNEEDATTKARHHHGGRARVVWRKYVG